MRANIWIKAENEEKWQALKNKSEFIHQALNMLEETDMPMYYDPKTKATVDGKDPQTILKTKQDAEKAVRDKIAEDITPKARKKLYDYAKNLCEHGQERGKCLVVGCKYGRMKK